MVSVASPSLRNCGILGQTLHLSELRSPCKMGYLVKWFLDLFSWILKWQECLALLQKADEDRKNSLPEGS